MNVKNYFSFFSTEQHQVIVKLILINVFHVFSIEKKIKKLELNIALAVLRGARGRLRREQSRDRRPQDRNRCPRRRQSHSQNGLRVAPSGMRPIVHVESRPQRAVPAAFWSVQKRCRETHSTTLARIFIVPILAGELLPIPLRKSAKSADWS